MKLFLLCLTLFSVFNLQAQQPSPTPPCGNNYQPGTSAPPWYPQSDGDPFDPYTGNDHRDIPDLTLFAGAGKHKLEWHRFGNTRYTNSVTSLGKGGNWRHSYQWEMVTAGTGKLTVYYPEGNFYTFTQATANQWVSTAAVPDRIFQNGTLYVLQKANGWRYFFQEYSAPGQTPSVYYRMLYFRDSIGTKYDLSYDTAGRVTSVSEPDGRSITVNYSGDNLTSVQSADGRTVNYSYTPLVDPVNGQTYSTLSLADYGDNTSAQYTYVQPIPKTRPVPCTAVDPRYKLPFAKIATNYFTHKSSVIGEIQNQMDYQTGVVLNSLGTVGEGNTTCPKVLELADGPASSSSFWMNETSGTLQWKQDGLGRRETFTQDQGGFGFTNSSKDHKGNITTMEKSLYGNLMKETGPDGSIKEFTRDDCERILTEKDALGGIVAHTRDSDGRVTRTDHPDGSFESFTYNSHNKVVCQIPRGGGSINYTYDSRGLVTAKTDCLGNVTSYTYNAYDLPLTTTDANGNTTSMEYNLRGQVTKITNPDSTYVVYEYDALGNLTKTTNELGKSWITTYDNYKRVISSTDPLGNTTSYTYASLYRNKPASVTLPSGKTTAFIYDAAMQLTSSTFGYGTPEAATTTYTYDTVGNLTKFTDASGNAWAYVYDNRHRVTRMADPLLNYTYFTYDANDNVLTEKRPDNGITTNVYDAMNRLTQTTDPKGQMTKMTYDASGNLLTLNDAKNNIYRNTYDLMNRKTAMIYPDNSQESYTYDAVGNLATYSNRGGQICTYTYDIRNRNTAYTWSDGTPGSTKTYDAASRLLTNANGVSTLTYTYDDANRLLSENQAITGLSTAKTVSYIYNADGNRSKLTYPGGTSVNYAYDGRNCISSISADGPPPIVTYTYDGNNNRKSKTLENGTVTNYVYDAANRVTNITHAVGTATPFASFIYGYSNVNNRKYVKREDGKGDTYTYDTTDQVTGVKYNATNPDTTPVSPQRQATYTYDANGNRVTVKDGNVNTNYSTNNLNQYTLFAGYGLGYDTKGNLASTASWTYSYDAQNRLTSATNGTVTISFAYDAKNRCVRRTINGVTSYLAYDGWSLIEEYDATGTQQARYIHGIQIDELLCMVNASGAHYYQHDAIGNVARLTNATGNVEESYTYDAFGTATIKNGSNNVLTTSAIGNRFLYTGREYLGELGLYDYRNRVYSPVLGRFLQTDPIRFDAGDTNIYRYVVNNSINSSDALGLDPKGHHLVPKAIWKTLSPRVRKIWDAAKNRLDKEGYKKHNGKSYNKVSSDQYKKAVSDKLKNFLKDKGKKYPDELSDDELQDFADEIGAETDGDIGAYNQGVLDEIAAGEEAAATAETAGEVADAAEAAAEIAEAIEEISIVLDEIL